MKKISEMNEINDIKWENYKKVDKKFNFCIIERIGDNIKDDNLIRAKLKMAK